MKMKSLYVLLVAFAAVFCFTSCISSEERIINRLNNLSEWMNEDRKNFDSYDWQEAINELAEIHEEMEYCEFTPEQMKEVGRIDGRLTAIIAKESVKVIGKEFTNIVKDLGDYFDGFLQGISESINEKDLQELEKFSKEITHMVDSICVE